MTTETSAEYRKGARDMVLLIESYLEVARQNVKPDLVAGLEHAMNVVAAITPPKFIR